MVHARKLNYKNSVWLLAQTNASQFDNSTLLAKIFDKPKEETMNDLLEQRMNFLGVDKEKMEKFKKYKERKK